MANRAGEWFVRVSVGTDGDLHAGLHAAEVRLGQEGSHPDRIAERQHEDRPLRRGVVSFLKQPFLDDPFARRSEFGLLQAVFSQSQCGFASAQFRSGRPDVLLSRPGQDQVQRGFGRVVPRLSQRQRGQRVIDVLLRSGPRFQQPDEPLVSPLGINHFGFGPRHVRFRFADLLRAASGLQCSQPLPLLFQCGAGLQNGQLVRLPPQPCQNVPLLHHVPFVDQDLVD